LKAEGKEIEDVGKESKGMREADERKKV